MPNNRWMDQEVMVYIHTIAYYASLRELTYYLKQPNERREYHVDWGQSEEKEHTE